MAQSPRPHDDLAAKRKPDMPPPVAPSSTAVANDLRTQAQVDPVQDSVMSNTNTDRRETSRPRTPTEPGRQSRGRNKSPSSPHSSSRSRPPSPDNRVEGRRRAPADGKDRPREDGDRQQRGTRIAGAAAERDRKERESRPIVKDSGKDARDHDRERGRDRGRDNRGGDGDRERDNRRDRYPADPDRERERDRERGGRGGRDKDNDRDKDRAARETERSGRRDSYEASGRRNEKESSRSSRRDATRSTDDLTAVGERDRNRSGADEPSHKRRRDDEVSFYMFLTFVKINSLRLVINL